MGRTRKFPNKTAFALLSVGLAAACSAGAGTDGDDAPPHPTGGGAGGGGFAGLDGGDPGDVPLTPETACVTESQKAHLVPLDLVIMLDGSGSMKGQAADGLKWLVVKDALLEFVQSPKMSGAGVGLELFPRFDANNEIVCDAGEYASLLVPIAELPGNASAVAAAMNAHTPAGFTPSAPALRGGLDAAKAHALQNPTHTVVVIYASDGLPTACSPQQVEKIANIAADGLTGLPSIRTFVIGVGKENAELTKIAAAGGSGAAFMVDTGQAVKQQFLDALDTIQDAALECEYLIPSPEGKELDFKKVNVSYTPGGGGAPETIPQVAGKPQCDQDSDGWYYDFYAAPSKMIMCPFTCQRLEGDPSGQLDILIGCQTVVKPPA